MLSSHVTKNPDIDIALSQRVDRLLVEDRTVVGVAVGDNVVRAGAVVLATGGFGGNPALFERYLPLAAANDEGWYIAGEFPTPGDIFKLVEPVNAYIEGVDRGAWVLSPTSTTTRRPICPAGW